MQLPPEPHYGTPHVPHIVPAHRRLVSLVPGYRKLTDPETSPLGSDEHFCVPEPVIVPDSRQEGQETVTVEGLETALVVMDPAREHGPDKEVIAPAGHFPATGPFNPALRQQP